MFLRSVTEMAVPVLYSDILCFPVKFNFLMGTKIFSYVIHSGQNILLNPHEQDKRDIKSSSF